MPHALTMPSPGFQAIILCGPGSSFPTFTANPDQNPKALIPIANRPMVWYPIDFCYRMGVTNIILVAPPSSAPAIQTAMNTNPHLTSLPFPRPDLLAPEALDQNTGTAQIFRLPEVRAVIKGDFIVLPCDLVCEIGGESLLESWMVKQAAFGGATVDPEEFADLRLTQESGKRVRRGGLGVWYDTRSALTVVGEETDFIATTPTELGPVPSSKKGSLLPHISELVYAVPKDTLNDIMAAKKALPIRHSLIRHHARLKMLSSHRDAHIYIFPAWVLDMINENEHMDSIGEDVIGWWAKSTWQEGLGEKLGLGAVFKSSQPDGIDETLPDNPSGHDGVDLRDLSTTCTSTFDHPAAGTNLTTNATVLRPKNNLVMPPILAYVPPSKSDTESTVPLIRRADTAPLLLSISLYLAKLESIEQLGRDAAPFAHAHKVAYHAGIASKTTVTRADCLLAENVTVEEKCAIKESVIGANCQIRQGAKLTRCLLMDGVVVGKNSRLTGCILGRRSEIGEESILQDCEIQENLYIEARTEDKGAKLMSSEGMEATEEEIQELADEQGLIESDDVGATDGDIAI